MFRQRNRFRRQLIPSEASGYRWMMTLQKLGFGGILADDMGLGKTVQAIAYLLARKQAAPLSAGKKEYLELIVCPASLIYNWENEVWRFALTGTPIENSLSELWSIFDFLMPGILSTNKQFRTKSKRPSILRWKRNRTRPPAGPVNGFASCQNTDFRLKYH
ncbi:MAG: hypothetical protein HFG65_01455 [Hungatella sp.]|nr:hypothetical protein [Hungatella sp.]